MKYSAIPLAICVAASSLAQAPSDVMPAGDDYRFQKFNSTVTQLHNYYFQPPAWDEAGVFVHRGDTEHADVFSIGSGIIFDYTNRRVDLDFTAIDTSLGLGTAAAQDTSFFATATHSHAISDVTGLTSALTGKQDALSGTGFVKISGTTISYDGNTYLTTEVDGSVTNEIELPSQSGQSGKVLSTNGSSPQWVAAGVGTITSITAGTGLSGGTITGSGTISLPNTGTAGTYAGVTTDAQGRVTAGTTYSFANPSRSLNSSFQIDASRPVLVSYTVDIGATLTLSGGATGTVFLEYADNSGMSTNLVTLGSTVNGNTGTLTVGLTLTQTASASLVGVIPAGKYVRLRTANTSGTPSFTFRSAQEVLL